MNFGYSTSFQAMDKGLIEKIGPSGFSLSIFNISSNFVSYSSGFLYHTIFIIICFALFFLSIYFSFAFGLFSSISFPFLLLFFSYLIVSLFKPTINFKF
jgi:hypothetical protein